MQQQYVWEGVPPPAAPDEATGAAVDAGAEVESDGGSDDDDDHAVKRAAFEAHARSLDGETQDATVGA